MADNQPSGSMKGVSCSQYISKTTPHATFKQSYVKGGTRPINRFTFTLDNRAKAEQS